jgi:hypothetical protein
MDAKIQRQGYPEKTESLSGQSRAHQETEFGSMG